MEEEQSTKRQRSENEQEQKQQRTHVVMIYDDAQHENYEIKADPDTGRAIRKMFRTLKLTGEDIHLCKMFNDLPKIMDAEHPYGKDASKDCVLKRNIPTFETTIKNRSWSITKAPPPPKTPEEEENEEATFLIILDAFN